MFFSGATGQGIMDGSAKRVCQAFAHESPDRTPLCELFVMFHPICWDICGRTVATDEAMRWDALAAGITWEELVEEDARAYFAACKFFGLDLIRVPGTYPRCSLRPVKTGRLKWTLNGIEYVLNERTALVEIAHPNAGQSYSNRISEEEVLREIENWDGGVPQVSDEGFAVYRRVRQMAEREGIDWVYMGEAGAGTGVAFYPPFMLMWLIREPGLLERWLEIQKASAFQRTKELINRGCAAIAMGGDVSCDKGPFISPTHYRQFIFPVIREHVALIQRHGALAVYTSDGNHWDIKDDFFFNSSIDGYLEVDKAAGMTWQRLTEEGIDERVCIIGNIDARHTLCHGTMEQVRDEVFECLTSGQHTPGGHILHSSHSVHADVKAENYYATVNAYREFFGMESLPRQRTSPCPDTAAGM